MVINTHDTAGGGRGGDTASTDDRRLTGHKQM